MPPICAAINCTFRRGSSKDISYFRFPLKDKELTKQWVINMKRDKWFPTKHSFLCSRHFEEKYIVINNDRRRLLSRAIPTVFDFPSHLMKIQRTRPPPTIRNNTRASSPTPPLFESSSTNMELNNSGSAELKIIGNDHAYCVPSPRKMKRMYDNAMEVNANLKKKIKCLQQNINRKRSKIINYQQLISGLNKRLCESGSEILDKCFTGVLKELLELQIKGCGQNYTEEIRRFALTLHFYSSRAYQYLRKHVKLPHPRTLRRWASVLDGNPGFTEESFRKITQEVEGSAEPILASLMFDEMAIKKDLVWDGNQICGYVNLGQGFIGSDDCPLAREALVFMVTALNRNWKIPVGYCLVDGTSASMKANLIEQYLRKLHETGVSIVSVVCDGTPTNKSVMQKLGVTFSGDNVQCWFPHPSFQQRKVYCIFDAAHMLKLMRNLLAEREVLVDGTIQGGDENKIKWEYFCSLVTLQENEGLHAANKLRRRHIYYETQKMKVALAAQTFSRSVGCAMSFCNALGFQEFAGCEPTVKFVKIIDLIFDILNSCHPLGKGTKSPISRKNRVTVCNQIKDCINYLQHLKLSDGTLVCNSNRKMPIHGLIVDLVAVKELAEAYVWNDDPIMKYFLTRRLSQDHLELFFSSLRSRGGNRNNPNALQFRSAYRKCLIARVQPSESANCELSDCDVLVPASGISSLQNTIDNRFMLNALELDHDYFSRNYDSISIYVDNVVEYIAGSVVRQASKKLKCLQCLEVLLANSSAYGSRLAVEKNVNGSLVNPSQDVVKLCKIAEKVFRNNYELLGKHERKVMLKLQTEVLSLLPNCLFFEFDHLFTAVEPGEESHYASLIKLILHQYFTCRLHHVCRSRSEKEGGKQVRQMFTKLILFKGQ